MLNSCNERESKNPAASERATKQDDIVNSGGGLGKPNAIQEEHLIWGGGVVVVTMIMDGGDGDDNDHGW